MRNKIPPFPFFLITLVEVGLAEVETGVEAGWEVGSKGNYTLRTDEQLQASLIIQCKLRP